MLGESVEETKVRDERAKHARTEVRATPRLQDGHWEVSVLAPAGRDRLQ